MWWQFLNFVRKGHHRNIIASLLRKELLPSVRVSKETQAVASDLKGTQLKETLLYNVIQSID